MTVNPFHQEMKLRPSFNLLSMIPEDLHNYDVVILRRTTTKSVKRDGDGENEEEKIFERKESTPSRRRCGDSLILNCCRRGGRGGKKDEDENEKKKLKTTSDGADNVRERVGMIFFLNELFGGFGGNRGPMFFEFSSSSASSLSSKSHLCDILNGEISKESGTSLFYLEEVVVEEFEKCEQQHHDDDDDAATLPTVKFEMFWRPLICSLVISPPLPPEEMESETPKIYAELYGMKNIFALEEEKVEKEKNPTRSTSSVVAAAAAATAIKHYRQPGTRFSAKRQIAVRNRSSLATPQPIVYTTREEVFGELLQFSGFVQEGVDREVLHINVHRLFNNLDVPITLKFDAATLQANYYDRAIPIEFWTAAATTATTPRNTIEENDEEKVIKMNSL